MVLVASLYELSRPSSPSGLLHDCSLLHITVAMYYQYFIISLIIYFMLP